MPYKDPEEQRAWWKQRRREIRRIVDENKSKPCADCNIQYPLCVMQYDHVRGEKAIAIGGATANVKSIKALYEEIAKCEVVCANCHAIRTFKRITDCAAQGAN